MKFYERFKVEHPEEKDVSYKIESGCLGCPSDFGYESADNAPCIITCVTCEECWNREMPNIRKGDILCVIRDLQINSYKKPKKARREITELIKKCEMDEVTKDEMTADFLKGFEYAVAIIDHVIGEMFV